MQFSTAILAALTISSSVFAVPVAEISTLEKRDTPIQTINNAITTLTTVAQENTVAISSAVASIGTSTSVQVQLVADINTDLGAIVSALSTAAAVVLQNTVAAVLGLTNPGVALVTAGVQVLIQLLATLQASLTGLNGIPPATLTLVNAEITTLKAAITAFVTPVVVYAQLIEGIAQGNTFTNAAALQTAINTLVADVTVFTTR